MERLWFSRTFSEPFYRWNNAVYQHLHAQCFGTVWDCSVYLTLGPHLLSFRVIERRAISPLVISFFRDCRWGPPMLFSRFLRRLDKLKGWKKDVAVGLIVSAVCAIGGGLWWGTTWMYDHWHESQTPPDAHARIRILDVVAVPMPASGAQFPALNIYYRNAGPLTATSIVSRYAAGFGGALSTEAVKAEQDKLLRWDGWESAMAARQQYEMIPEILASSQASRTWKVCWRSNFARIGTR